jgi:hypothetical protein
MFTYVYVHMYMCMCMCMSMFRECAIIYAYVCMYVCMRVCGLDVARTDSCLCTHTCAPIAYIFVYLYMYTYVYTRDHNTCAHMYIDTNKSTYIHTQIHIHTQIRRCLDRSPATVSTQRRGSFHRIASRRPRT